MKENNVTADIKNKLEGRRALAVRKLGVANTAAAWLSKKQVSPNKVSIFSVVFAVLAAGCLASVSVLDLELNKNSTDFSNLTIALPILAALFIQCRLLCNLFDGMLAVEGGKHTPSGELFNDIPDRIADPIILIAAGYAVSSLEWGMTLGWLAGLLAVMTAYIRTLATSIGAPVDYSGPMAKQHRMALITIACILTVAEIYFWPFGYSLSVALVLINLGALLTIYRRIRHAYQFLESANGLNDPSLNNRI